MKAIRFNHEKECWEFTGDGKTWTETNASDKSNSAEAMELAANSSGYDPTEIELAEDYGTEPDSGDTPTDAT